MHFLVRIYSNQTIKALALVFLSVFTEIVIYVILGLCCVFTSLIIQIHDIIEKSEEKLSRSSSALVVTENKNERPIRTGFGGDIKFSPKVKQK